MRFFLILYCTFISIIYAQTDWVRWDKCAVSYSNTNTNKSNEILHKDLLTITKSLYNFLISDLDGDNCPFYPSCSEFFVDAVKKTNLFKGTLMFVDRFTRDINFFKGRNHYAYHISGKFFDPVENYSLLINQIKFYPDKTFAK